MEKSVNSITKWLLVFLAIFVPFRELISFYTTSFIKFIPDILIWILFIMVLIKNRFKLNLKLYDYLYIIFLCVGLLSTLVNKWSIIAYGLQFRSITTMYILFYILRNTKLTAKDFKPAIITLIVVTTLFTSIGIFEHISRKCLFYPEEWALDINYISNFTRVYSLVRNPNTFAIFIFMTMIVAYYSEKELKYSIPKVYYILVFLGIVLSASRSTMIAVVMFFLYLLFFDFKDKKFKNTMTMGVLLLLAFVISFGLDFAQNKVNYICKANVILRKSDGLVNSNNPNGEEGSNNGENSAMLNRWQETISGNTLINSADNGRIFIIKTGLKIFKDYPILGTGFGTYGSAASKMITPKIYEKYNLYEGFYSDNDYIKIFVETGILGTFLYGAFILSLLYFCKDNKYKAFMFIVFLMIGMFYNVSEMQIMCLILYISFIFFDSYKKKSVKNGG